MNTPDLVRFIWLTSKKEVTLYLWQVQVVGLFYKRRIFYGLSQTICSG
jgi:hypothetical protein